MEPQPIQLIRLMIPSTTFPQMNAVRPVLVKGRSDGVALVIVLGFLVLISALMLAFFSSVQTELQGAKSYAGSVTVKQLGETATNMVLSQIGDATKSFENPANPATGVGGSGKRLTWASQPGMIHTFDDDGRPHRAFKLYSAANMVDESGSPYNPATKLAAEVPDSWPTQPGHFTDLNAPVLVFDENGSVIGGDGKKYTADFPIVDPSAFQKVDGFDYDGVPGVSGGKVTMTDGYDPTKPNDKFTSNPVPMPVRWLYVLKDGTVSAPDSVTNATTTVTFSNFGPTLANPIVGRIAFWTDDESSKLNLNTASEGIFWDRPWAENSFERKFAESLPKQNEFNRFAGHPAVTSLSPVFKDIFPVTHGDPKTTELTHYLGTGSGAIGSGLAPRVNLGTDVDGATKAVRIKNERLYASVDELLFKPKLLSGSREEFNPKLNRGVLEKAKFFVTANSRAPEVNLYGQPRVSLWPLQLKQDERNPKDKLIAFCTSVGNPGSESRFYFQRFSKYSGDGRGAGQVDPAPSSQDVNADWQKVVRNQQLYTYLQNLMGKNVPGFGGTFSTKFGADQGQVLTEMFDYIRSGVNSYNTALQPKYDYLPTRAGLPVAGETQAVPLILPGTDPNFPNKGFGRFATVPKVALVFFATNAKEDGGAVNMMQAYLVLDLFNPTPGLASWSPHVRYVVKGLEHLKVDGTSLGFKPADTDLNPRNYVTSRVGFSGGGHATSLMGGPASFACYKGNYEDQSKTANRDNEETGYPFYSEKIAMPTKPFELTTGADSDLITIEIYSGYEKAAANKKKPSQLVQIIQMKFPKAISVPLPTKGEVKINNRFSASVGNLIRSQDVVRSVEFDHANPDTLGDYRMLAGRFNVPRDWFQPHPKYNPSAGVPGVAMAHSLRQDRADYAGASGALTPPQVRLLKDVALPAAAQPVAARDLNGAFLKKGTNQYPGDWDNGTGGVEDGAYINKADEGNSNTPLGGYYDRGSFNVEDGTTFSPNRQISSAVAFGSLPTGIKRNQPWQTLLFCKNPAAGSFHPGFDIPRDHLLLDLFTMPVVEPYAISEPFSTAGKVNLNFQIAPFTYITRSTAMRGVMKSTKVMAIPTKDNALYKTVGNKRDYRTTINLDETLSNSTGTGGFQARFAKTAANPYVGEAGIFRSASEICDMFLVPNANKSAIIASPSFKDMDDNSGGWWKDYKLTGDNVREYPYGHIYPRVTTKSNTYTVHVRVQVLRKVKSTDQKGWVEGKDQIVSEHRGSTIVERYVDPSDAALQGVDFATNANASLDDYYRFRTISTKKFSP